MVMVHTGGVGDFICTFPTLAGLSTRFQIEIAGIPERALLAREAGLASAVHNLENTGFHSVFSEPNDQLRSFASHFDEALIWMSDDGDVIRQNLRQLGIPSVRCFPGIPPSDWTRHAAHWYASCAGTEIELPFTAAFQRSQDPPEVVLHPGSGSARKNWPLEHFETVADALERRGHDVVWCAGPAESGIGSRSSLLSPLSLTELARILAGARLFIGNDSGLSHLAGAAGCPTLTVFGPTNPRIWAPCGPRVRVVHNPTWATPESVLAAAAELLSES